MGISVLIKGLDKVIEFPTDTKLLDIENSIKVNWNEVESISGLPMDTASRMERAKHLGFDPNKKFFHGTPDADFDEFDANKIGQNFEMDEQGFFFSDDVRSAREAGMEIKEVLLPKEGLKIDAGDEDPTTFFDIQDKDAFFEGLQAEGIDTAFITNDLGETTAISINPEKIRSIDAEFNPTKSASGNLLASAAPAAAGLAGIGGILQPDSAAAGQQEGIIPSQVDEPLFTADQAKGALDVLATVGSGLLGQAVGGIGGIITGDPGAIQPISEGFSRQPSTEEGKAILQKLMKVLGPIEAVNQFLSETGSEAAFKAGKTISPEVGAAAGAATKALVEVFSPI